MLKMIENEYKTAGQKCCLQEIKNTFLENGQDHKISVQPSFSRRAAYLHGCSPGSLGQLLPLMSLPHPSSPVPAPLCQIKGMPHALLLFRTASRHPGQPFCEGSTVCGLGTVPDRDAGSSHRPSSQIRCDHVSTSNGLCLLRRESVSPSHVQIHVVCPKLGEKHSPKGQAFSQPL